MLKKYTCFILLIFVSVVSYSQINSPGGVNCNQAGPICADNTGSFVFQNNNDATTNIDTPVACLQDAPRPAWFFLKIDQDGDLAFEISQTDTAGGGLDVDFVLWGPFSSPDGNCTNLDIVCDPSVGGVNGCPDNTADPNFYPNTNTNIVDCSYDFLTVESMSITNAQSGEFYLLLVSNFEGGDGTIEITQTNFGTPGAGSTDCTIINIDGILGPDQNICEMTSTTLDANPMNDTNFVDYTWEYDDGSGFAPIPGTDGMSTITVSDAGEYQVTIIDNLGGSDDDIIEIIVTTIPIANPVDDQIICDNNNDGFWDFDFTTLSATITGAQTNVEVSYHNSLIDAEMDMNPIIGLYQNATAYTLETIFVRVESRINADCATTSSFDINVFNLAIANPIDDQLICDDNNDGFWDFDLDALRATVLGTQAIADYTVSFHATQVNADNNLSGLPNSYTNMMAYTAETIFVRIENNANTDCFATTSFLIDVFDVPTANVVDDQLICDDNNDGFWDFDLDALQPDVLGTQIATQYNITFHTSFGAADTDTDVLASPYTNQTAYTQEPIFVRIENVDNEQCYAISDFTLQVYQQPEVMPDTYALCDDELDGDDTNGFVEFNLISRDDDILNGQDPTVFTVTYYETQADADAMMPMIDKTLPYTNATANNDQIVVRVTNNDNTNCYTTTTLDLVVHPRPVLLTDMVELKQCDDDTDGFADFNLTQVESLLSANALNETFTYYLTQAEAESGMGGITNTTAYTNIDPSTNPDILYVRVETSNGCYRLAQLDLLVATTAIPNGLEILYEICDVGTVDNDIANGIETFDFSDAEAQIRAQVMFPVGQNLIFTYYETRDDAEAEINAIPDISNHRNDFSPFEQEIYVRVDGNIENDCIGLGVHVRLRTLNPEPNIPGMNENIILCDDITVGDMLEEFDLTQNETFIFNSIPNLAATYFLDYTDALNNVVANQIATPATYNNTLQDETIYVRVEDTVTGCIAIVDFDIRVNPLPNDAITVADIFECESSTNTGFVEFDLESKTNDILNIQDDASNYTVTYHDSQLGADNLTDALSSPYTNTVNPIQTIYVAVTNNTTACSISTINFNIEVQDAANPADVLYEECDVVGDNDGFTQFDLESIEPRVLNGQDPVLFSIDFFDNFDDAFTNNLPNRLPLLYENVDINSQVIYARVSNNIRPEECFDVSEVTLQVNWLPIFDLEDEYILCLSSNDEGVVDVPLVLDTQLSDADYDFEWRLDGNIIQGEVNSTLIPVEGGIYDVIATDVTTSTVTMCTNFDTTEVIESGIPDTFTIDVTSQTFSGNNMIVVETTGVSTYEYSLDNGPWQLSGDFEDVTGGDHTVFARDINGCGIVSQNVSVIDYPKFFTPNGDGNNDTWTIKGIDSQPFATIYIFDRYGKLIKQLSPTSPGWDGTYNGNRMPSSDYWFTLEYIEPITNEKRTFTEHFALKR